MADLRPTIAVFAGGMVGTMARTEVGEALTSRPGHWPWATFLVNVAGAALLGVLAACRTDATSLTRRLWGTGLCGGLTTFSAMQVELLTMLDRGDVALALGYAAASVALGLLAIRASTILLRRA